jgi:outer membrane lipoprotein-sorting protein
MLRQSVMGSDLSYEDMMEDEKLSDIYDAKVDRLENVASRSCFVVKLVATKKEVAYQTRTIWVDQERYVPVKEELFAKSGKLLKNITLGDFRFIQNRWYPFSMTFKDVLKNGKGTEFVVDSIKFNEQIPNHIFSKASLRR